MPRTEATSHCRQNYRGFSFHSFNIINAVTNSLYKSFQNNIKDFRMTFIKTKDLWSVQVELSRVVSFMI